jgi:hypothetical protein
VFLKRLILRHMKAITHKLKGLSPVWMAVVMFVCISSFVFAAKGDGDDKGKKGYVLKFNGFEVKKTYLSPLSLMQQGAIYKGTINPMQTPNSSQNPQHSIITYQKGNTIFIYPIQQKGLIHKFKTPSK